MATAQGRFYPHPLGHTAAHHAQVADGTDKAHCDFFGNPIMTFTWTNYSLASQVAFPGRLPSAATALTHTYDPEVLRPTLNSSQRFLFAGFDPSPTSQPLLPCRVTPHQQANPAIRATMPAERRYTSGLVADDDEVLAIDWRQQAAAKQNRGSFLLDFSSGDPWGKGEKSLPVLASIAGRSAHTFQETRPGARRTPTYRPLRHRVIPPRPIDIKRCQEFGEEERACLGEQVEIVTDSDDESDGSRSRTSSTSAGHTEAGESEGDGPVTPCDQFTVREMFVRGTASQDPKPPLYNYLHIPS